MKVLKKKIVMGALAGLMIGNTISVAQAAEEPVAGINLLLQSDEHNLDEVNEFFDFIQSRKAFADVTNYVNIRKKPNTEGAIIGMLYDGSMAHIIEEAGDWYKIKSGTIEGYIMKEYLMTGYEAYHYTKENDRKIAKVTTDTLRIRREDSMNSDIIDLAAAGSELLVIDEGKDWTKIATSNGKQGYVSNEFVEIGSKYKEAVSYEEEMKRLASSLSSSSTVRNQLVDYALQFEGNPYAWGGTSLLYGADCSGYTQSVFRKFGIELPRTSRMQANAGRKISMSQIQPGDLVFYARGGTINHVAIYIGNGQVISASSPSTGIRISNVYYRTPVSVVSYIS